MGLPRMSQAIPTREMHTEDLVGGSAALSALSLSNTAVGNYFFLAINKMILRRRKKKRQSNWGSFILPLPPSEALSDKAVS